MYDIQSISDFHTGAALVVRAPENEIDNKALYTILADKPDFILPFRHRAIDGQIEFIYQIGNRNKFVYLYGSRTPSEYAGMWAGIIRPLLDCGDWFMTPYSFVLKPEFLYCEKDSDFVSYIYIPSTRLYSNNDMLKNMIIEIAKQNHVTDVNLENKVVWAIQDFNPSGFLQMLKPYSAAPLPAPAPEQKQTYDTSELPVQPETRAQNQPARVKSAQNKPASKNRKLLKPGAAAGTRTGAQDTSTDGQKISDDISINIPSKETAPKAKTVKEKIIKEKIVKEKISKDNKPKKNFLSFINKEKADKPKSAKKDTQQEIIQGAAAVSYRQAPVPEQPFISSNAPRTGIGEDITQIETYEKNTPKFRYIGTGGHPGAIDIEIENGGIFTIGRFDVSVGVKQSNFEFDKKTKAVSRRHAAVERNANGYIIVDLNSSAGTFVNGKKLPSNTPMNLENGCRVSFGHSGADYIWEE